MKQLITLKHLFLFMLICAIIISCNNSDTIATVNFRVEGCFASGKSKITLFKRNDSTIAELESFNENSQKANLNPSQIDTFNLFIRDLKNLKEGGGCTTVGYYTVYFDNEKIKKTDGSCNWNGFYNLKKCLFGIP